MNRRIAFRRAGRGPWLALAVVLAGCGIGTAAATESKGVFTPVPAAVATTYQTITSSGPLSIFLGTDLAAQISHVGDTSQEVYPPGTVPGDYGTFVVVNDTLYAPDFTNHGGTATGSIGARTVFTPVSQTPVTGAGTSASPYTVTTVVTVGAIGLTISQVDSYIVGQESYQTDITLTSAAGAGPVTAILYRAMDCYLQGSDSGFGVQTGTAIGCTANANNVPPARIEELVPITGGNNYLETGYSSVWAAIGSHLQFADSCDCTTNEDNGAGISWNVTVPAGGSVTRSHQTVFSPTGGGPPPPPPPPQTPVPTLSPGMLAGLALVLLLAGFFMSRRRRA